MNKLQYRRYTSLGDAIRLMLRQNGLGPELDRRRIYAAWDDASGAGPYTLRRYFKDGRLYITVNSSVIRSQLHFQKDALLEKINALLSEDALFSSGGTNRYVKELIIK